MYNIYIIIVYYISYPKYTRTKDLIVKDPIFRVLFQFPLLLSHQSQK